MSLSSKNIAFNVRATKISVTIFRKINFKNKHPDLGFEEKLFE